MTPAAIGSAGLVLDIVGVFLLFKFGLPSELVHPDQADLLAIGIASDDKRRVRRRRWDRHRLGSRMGLTSLVVGFVLQIAGNVTPPSLAAPIGVALSVLGIAVLVGIWLWWMVVYRGLGEPEPEFKALDGFGIQRHD